MLPKETRQHLLASLREGLLAVESWLEARLAALERLRPRRPRGGA